VLAVVIPTLNAARTLPLTLSALSAADQIVVADGGSSDGTQEWARSAGALLVTTSRSRGVQLAAGTAAAQQPWLLLLHADTTLDPGWVAAAMAHIANGPERAGYFRFAVASTDPRARWLEWAVAWRCHLLGLPYGDQGLLIHRDLLSAVGGIRPLPLMEDVDLARRLGRRRLTALPAAAVTSAEKWERDGWGRRSLRNLLCLSLWFAGVPPERLLRLYE
jgi:rSAM/selenodomain-associated transferase 2